MPKVSDVAVIFEGGGMRNSYTAGCVDQLLEHDIEFGWAGGVSAGCTHTVNFLSRDRERNFRTFVEFGPHPSTGGVVSLLQGKGYFNAKYIYEEIGQPEAALPYNFEAFLANDTDMSIQATRADDGEPVVWDKQDMVELIDLMRRVRASSTLPFIMPIATVDGQEYIDGALSGSGGIPVDLAEKAGYEKFLVIRTKPRGYVRPEVSRPGMLRQVLRRRPAVAEAMITRPAKYNATVDYINELERQGKAKVFYPENMQITATERRSEKIKESFNLGVAQTKREWDDWMAFLGL